jgi:TRAP-type C4-dicarboxylate transport system permease small subunit
MTRNSTAQKLIDLITRTLIIMAMISMFAMMLLITLDVTLNKVAGQPIPGTLEVTAYYFMVLVVFLTFANLEKNDAHISADFIVARFSPQVQSMIRITGKLLTIIFYGLLTYGALAKAIQSTRTLETVMSNFTFYIWPARWGVVLGLVSAIFVIVLILMQSFKNSRRR